MENQPSIEDDSTASSVSTEANPSDSQPDLLNNGSTDALAKALATMLTSLIRDFDSKAQNTLDSQDLLNSALDPLTRELDQLLEDAPLPFIMQHAAKISSVRKRVSSLNLVLKSIQRRLDNVDRMLQTGKAFDALKSLTSIIIQTLYSALCVNIYFEDRDGDEGVLEGLLPHSSLQKLHIEDFGGTCLSSWMLKSGDNRFQFNNLVVLEFEREDG